MPSAKGKSFMLVQGLMYLSLHYLKWCPSTLVMEHQYWVYKIRMSFLRKGDQVLKKKIMIFEMEECRVTKMANFGFSR